MKDLDAFIPKIKVSAPGLAEPTALDAIRDAAAEFCRRTRLWRYVDEFAVTADAADVATPYGSVLLDIERLNFNGQKLEKVSSQWLDEHVPDWRDDTTGTAPRWFTQTSLNTISIVPPVAGTVKLWVTLSVGQDAEQVPDFLADQHRETIAQGALARILMIPGKPFTNPQLAATKAQQFEQALEDLQAVMVSGQQRAPARSRPSFF